MGEEFICNGSEKDRLVAIGVLAAGIAHDINNITSWLPDKQLLLLCLSKITKTMGNEQQAMAKDSILCLEKWAEATSAAVAAISDLCKLQLEAAAGKEMAKTTVYLPKLLKDTIACAKSTAEKLEIQLSCNILADTILICSSSRMRQLFLNLITNAICALKNKAGMRKINIRLYEKPDSVVFSISDNGCGIPENQIAHICKRGFTTKRDGYGIGLATVRAVVEENNGEITVESKAGAGTTFKIEFPLTDL